jgi:hypothetical protein
MTDQSDLPTALDMLDTVLVLITGAVLAAPMLPGFVLTVPALILVAVVALAPLIAGAALVTLIGAILAMPYLLVRYIRGIRSRRMAPEPASIASPSVG